MTTGELSIPQPGNQSIRSHSVELSKRLAAWRISSDIFTASELVETAIVEGFSHEAERAARTLLLPEVPATPLLKKQATLLLQRVEGQPHRMESPNQSDLNVAIWRNRTRAAPRDALAWVELALAYIIVRKPRAAERSMSIALQLAPHDRYVLRSASRLYLHLRDPEHAHDLLKRNVATRIDPWLIAGEIALSALAERNPEYYKIGNALLERGNLQPKQISELAGALATVDLSHGNRKARKLFHVSLVDPTGNSLAQAEWASPQIGNLVTTNAIDRVIESSEARVFKAYWEGNFQAVIKACDVWANEEQYSSRPSELASTAAITIEEYAKALELTDNGLTRNAASPTLHNNRAFALIALGRTEEASIVLRTHITKVPEQSVGPLVATSGFLALRTGLIERGVALYREAISIFRRNGQRQAEALAFAYFAQEASRAQLIQAGTILQEAKDIAREMKSLPDLKIILPRAELWVNAVAQRTHPMEIKIPQAQK